MIQRLTIATTVSMTVTTGAHRVTRRGFILAAHLPGGSCALVRMAPGPLARLIATLFG